ncbi:NUDIX hydrolase [Desulfoplanes formicivorans]|uniref:NUDIX hydrolase n=1 Tax=Desulfoplanes formicivorans TaxID=1592317 RepID=A0A194AGS8_9BACT|nr:NUDIX hydrolase [Desulfoplanes formicivorans]GAU09282.1 NUDIX hydrolase [Desulfoplanes formicivorans]
MHDNSPQWLKWARTIQAISQIGLTYKKNHYDEENFTQLMHIAADMVAYHTQRSSQELEKNFLAQPGYATVKVDVRGALVHEGRLLLVKERADGKWTMPGGWADVGETPSQSIIREVREESGFEVRPTKVIAVLDANRRGRPLEFYHAFKIIFLCEMVGGEPTPSEETSEVGFFDMDDLPELSVNRTSPEHIAEIKKHLQDPCRPAAFD